MAEELFINPFDGLFDFTIRLVGEPIVAKNRNRPATKPKPKNHTLGAARRVTLTPPPPDKRLSSNEDVDNSALPPPNADLLSSYEDVDYSPLSSPPADWLDKLPSPPDDSNEDEDYSPLPSPPTDLMVDNAEPTRPRQLFSDINAGNFKLKTKKKSPSPPPPEPETGKRTLEDALKATVINRRNAIHPRSPSDEQDDSDAEWDESPATEAMVRGYTDVTRL